MTPSPFLRLLRQAKPFWPHLCAILGLQLLATPLALLQPVPIKLFVDSVVGDAPAPGILTGWLPSSWFATPVAFLGVVVILLILVQFLVKAQGLGTWLLGTYTSQRLLVDFRARLFQHAQRLSLRYHDARGSTDSSFRILYDAPSIHHVAIDGVLPLISAVFTFASMLIVTALISWKLALIALCVSPILFLATRWFSHRVRSTWKLVKNLESSALSVVQESLAASRVVKAFGRERHENERFVEVAHRGLRANMAASWVESAFGLVIGLALALGLAAVLWVGGQQVLDGELTLGTLLLVFAYVGQLYAPLSTMAKKTTSLQSSLASAERAFELLDTEPEVVDHPRARHIDRCRGELRFEGVSFAYDADHPVLENLDLVVPAGSRVGIAGHTGAGKTTLMSLLMRFYDPTSGRITLDGIPLPDYALADLRKQFSIVLQEPVLFHASIAENIAYAKPEATEVEIQAAARAANAETFIESLPERYDTVVGERGARLSGGERQRISIARAFLVDAPILLLDEPTSSVDTATEEGILDALERLMKHRTTFMIAHRLSTLDNCSLRIELSHGKLVSVSSQADRRKPLCEEAS